jgi:hypothetical protein
MALTDHSDIYSALHEDGVNRLIDHLMRKRPTLFNYGTERIVRAASSPTSADRRLLCDFIEYDSEVLKRVDVPIPADADSPIMTEQNPLPVLGTDDLVALDYCIQVVEMAVDFAPTDLDLDTGDDVGLVLGPQQFAASVTVCAGLACPDDDEYDEILTQLQELRDRYGDELDDPDLRTELGLPIVPEPEALHCFCLRVSLVGSVELVERGAVSPVLVIEQSPRLVIDDLWLASLDEQKLSFPRGMTQSLECYLHSFVQLGLLPTLSATLEEVIPKTLEMEFIVFNLEATRMTVSLPTLDGVPNNPALEDDQFKLYVDVDLELVEEA